METLLTNAYTRLDKKSKLFETNSGAIGTKELLQRKRLLPQNDTLQSLLIEWIEVTKLSYGN